MRSPDTRLGARPGSCIGLFYGGLWPNVLGILGLVVYIVLVIALAAAITWLVVKISPTTTGKKRPSAKSSGSD